MKEQQAIKVNTWGWRLSLSIALVLIGVVIVNPANAQPPCSVSWVASSDGFWDVAANWSTGVVPGPSDDVCIDVAGEITVTHRQDTTLINSLQSQEALYLSGGILEVTTTVQVNHDFTLSGGTLKNATVLPGTHGGPVIITTNSYNRLDGVTLEGELDLSTANARLRLVNGLTLNSTLDFSGSGTTLYIEGSQGIAGSGTLRYSHLSGISRISAIGAASLTLGPDITLRGGRVYIGNGSALSLINDGTILADIPGQTLWINPSAAGTFENPGTLRVDGGILVINVMTGNVGATEIANGGHLDLDGAYTLNQPLAVPEGTTLTLRGTWTNSTTLSAANATVNLDGQFTLSDLGTFNRSGGTVNLTGTLDNTGTTLALDAGTGDWQLNGGTIVNGTITTADGARLIVTTNGYNRLDGVTLEGELDLSTANARLRLVNGLTLNSTLDFSGGGTTLYIEGSQGIAGSGTLRYSHLSGISRISAIGAAASLTLGPDITLRGGRVYIGNGSALSLINDGTILADIPGQTLWINPSAAGTFENPGTLRAEVGTLDIGDTVIIDSLARLYAEPVGTIAIAGNLLGNTQHVSLYVPNGTIRLDGAGTAIEPQLLEVMGQNVGNIAAGFEDNFTYGNLALGTNTYVRLVDQSDNSSGTGAEALYVNSLIIGSGTTFDLNGLQVFVRTAQIDGAVVGGIIEQICELCDVNCDGLINIFDLQLVINCILGSGSCDRCDLNSDGLYNIFDLQLVINCILGS